jgi:hypothetical protein
VSEPGFSRCRACPATIRWETTVKGRPIPLDVDPCIDGNIELHECVAADSSGIVMRAVVIDVTEPPSGFRYKSHFATCPAARQFSRGVTERARRRVEDRVRKETE